MLFCEYLNKILCQYINKIMWLRRNKKQIVFCLIYMYIYILFDELTTVNDEMEKFS